MEVARSPDSCERNLTNKREMIIELWMESEFKQTLNWDMLAIY